MQIDKRKKYFLGIDTETCPIKNDGVCDPFNSLVYDIGYQIVDKKGNVYLKRSFVVREIFQGEKNRMRTAYYAKKIPNYTYQIWNGTMQEESLLNIMRIMRHDMKMFNCKTIFAHNARFDYHALNNTIRYVTNFSIKYFFPYGIEIFDTLKMARDVIGKMKTYVQFCNENGYLTSRGQLRFTAEILYRFLTNNINFTEQHTGLKDVEIETEIFAYCYKQHKKMRKYLVDKNN